MSVASLRRRVTALRAVTGSVVVAGIVCVLPWTSHAQQLETVLSWNQVMATALVVPGANPATVFVSRPIAITGVAMFDAANAFEKAGKLKPKDAMEALDAAYAKSQLE